MSTVEVRQPSRLFWWAVLVSMCLLVGSAVVVQTWPLIVGTAFGSPLETTQPPDDTGLPGQAVPILDSPHIPVSKAGTVRYNSVPPTSGPHFAVAPATGNYDTPLPEGLQIHALEHGHVGIQYAPDTPAAVVADLRRVGARYPRDVFVAPYARLTGGIALTAWGRIETLGAFDEAGIVRFVEALRNRYSHGWTARAGRP
jgi:hypothetical protein